MKTINLFLILTIILGAAPTPLKQELKEDTEVTIECDRTTKKEKVFLKTTKEAPKSKDRRTGFHYKLYIPKGYHKSKSSRFPVMFIASPGGNANMHTFKQRLKEDRWVVVMLVESKNGNPDWFNNFIAAHDDVMKRCKIAKNGKFATGMSGGSRCASTYPMHRDGFQAVILQAAGFFYGVYDSYRPGVKVAISVGDSDFNKYEAQSVRRYLSKKCDYSTNYFKGGHSWAPTAVLNQMADWMEYMIFVRKDPRPPKAKATKGLFQWYYSNQLRKIKNASDDKIKYHLIRHTLSAVKNGKLDSNPVIKKDCTNLREIFTKLLTNADIQKEKQAMAHYKKVKLLDLAYRKKVRKGKKNKKTQGSSIKRLITGMEAFTAKFEGLTLLSGYNMI
ncbi:MAG: hypothetical protein HRT89_02005 [Lentisphaeria bacterium]|nr:hypothetical protein [Lentisphaeria bacterium]